MQETHYEDRVDVRVGPLSELLKTSKIDLMDKLVKSVTITPLNEDQIGGRLAAAIRDLRTKPTKD